MGEIGPSSVGAQESRRGMPGGIRRGEKRDEKDSFLLFFCAAFL